jgi:hypothetical protein
VLVDPQGAELDLHRDFHEEFSHSLFSSSLDIPSNIVSFLGRHGVSCDQKVKVEEYCIKPKNALFVLGTLGENHGVDVAPTPVQTLVSEPLRVSFPFSFANLFSGPVLSVTGSTTFTAFQADPSASPLTRTSADNRTAPTGDPAQQKKIADALLKAGITSPMAWAAAGVNPSAAMAVSGTGSGAAAAAAPAPAPEQFDLHPMVVLKKGGHNPAFFVSWRSQRDVVRSLGWKCALMIWGGPALTLLCAYIVALEFGWL